MTAPFTLDAHHLYRQFGFSQWTFGPGVRTAGIVDHIGKELEEIAAAPTDLTEWVDVVILALDGAMRAGHHPQSVLDAIAAKQMANENRVWPDWRDASPETAIEHVRDDKPDSNDSDSRSAAEPPAGTAAATPVKPKPKPKKATKSKKANPTAGKKRTGRLPRVVAERVDQRIRAALEAGKDPAEIAQRIVEDVELSVKGALARIGRIQAAMNPPATPTSPPRVREASPTPATLSRKSPPSPPATAGLRSDEQLVSALGAQRRILSLFTIGYDPDRLNRRLHGIEVESVLRQQDIMFADFQLIDALWRRLRYTPMTSREGQNIDRTAPPPGAWTNIDDPNERPKVAK